MYDITGITHHTHPFTLSQDQKATRHHRTKGRHAHQHDTRCVVLRPKRLATHKAKSKATSKEARRPEARKHPPRHASTLRGTQAPSRRSASGTTCNRTRAAGLDMPSLSTLPVSTRCRRCMQQGWLQGTLCTVSTAIMAQSTAYPNILHNLKMTGRWS
jgi:hypothetical protein